MQLTAIHRGRLGALAPAVLLLLALCLLVGGAQAADVPRYVVGDVLEITASNLTSQIVIAKVDTTSLPTPYYTAFDVVQNAGRWEIPRYWNFATKVDEQNLVENLHAQRVGHVDPVLVVITDPTITGGFMQYTGLSLAEAQAGVIYPVEPAPGESGNSPFYVVGDILGNVSDPNRGAVVSRVYDSEGTTWYRVYFDAVRSGDRWILDQFYNNDMGFTGSYLDQNGMRRAAHADPHTVIINDTTSNTGEIGWYRLSLAEFLAGKGYDHMGAWHFNTGDILGNGTATRYIVGNATVSDSGPSHYTLYEVVRGADGWEIPGWVNAGVPLEIGGGEQLDTIPYDLVDHTDPHFAIVTDASIANGLTCAGLSLGEIIEGTPGYPPASPGPIGGDVGYFLVSTVPAGAEVSLVDISGTRYPKGNTSAGPLNISIYLTATPIRQIVANLSGYRDAVFNVTQYPPKGGTLPVSLTLEPVGGPQPYRPLSVPGRIQAEDYNLGGEGVAYHDTTPGNSGGAYRTDAVDIEVQGSVTNVGWIRNGEFLTYTANVAEAGAYTMQARVASPNSGRTATVSVDGVQTATIAVPNTGSFATFRTVEVPVTLPAGTHTLKLAFSGDGQNLDWIELAPVGVTTPTPTPYVSVINIPGTIQAEDYNLGGEGVAYHDTTAGNSGGAYRQDGVDVAPIAGGHAVVGIEDGEWLTYSIGGVSSTPQLPALVLYLGSNRDGGSVQVEVNGRIAGNVSVPNTGSPTAFRAVQTQVVAAEGTLRLRFHGSGMGMDRIESPVMTNTGDDYNWANFTADPVNGTAPLTVRFTDTSSEFAYEWQWVFGDGTTSTERNPVHTFQRPGAYTISLNIKEADHWSFGGYIHIWNDPYHGKAMQITVEETGPAQGHAIPGTIQAEDYNLGGEGVAYHDTTPGNSGGAYRTDDVDIETVGGITNVGWIRNGEYLTYTANVAEAGAYTMRARVASPNIGRTAALSVDGVQKATIAVPNTGSFATFRTVEVPVTLPAGTHTLKLAFSGDGQNLDWVAFAPVGVTTPTPTPTPTAGGASFIAAPLSAPKGAAVKFTVTPASGKKISAAWWSFDATAHLNTWNSRTVNPTFYYPAKGTFTPLVKLTYTDGSTETVQRTNYIRAT